MSVEAMSWALSVPVGGNEKVILLGLANHAHPDGSDAYPSLDTLARYAHCERTTARRNVRKLVTDGWVAEDGKGPRGTVRYRLLMGGSKTPPIAPSGVAPTTEGGSTSALEGVAPVLPEPSKGTVQEPPESAQQSLDGADPALERALSWLEEEIEKNTGTRPRTTAASRRAVANILGRFPTGQAKEPMERALAFAYSDRFWSTRITRPPEFEQAFTRLLSGANADDRRGGNGRVEMSGRKLVIPR